MLTEGRTEGRCVLLVDPKWLAKRLGIPTVKILGVKMDIIAGGPIEILIAHEKIEGYLPGEIPRRVTLEELEEMYPGAFPNEADDKGAENYPYV